MKLKLKKTHYLLPLRIEELEDGRFLGRSPSLPGLNVQAETVDEILRLAPRIARALIEAMREKGVPLPRGLAKRRTPLRVELLLAV